MTLREAGRRRLAAQLANPHGLAGRWVARQLNARNRPLITTAVDSLQLAPGASAADVGFGGGLGLRLLLDAVGPTGTVHGVDRSETALAGVRRAYAGEIAAGVLHIHDASMTALPLPDGAVHGALTANTIYFLDDAGLAAAFSESERVLRPGGRLALGIGDPDAMARDPLMAHGFRVRPIDELVAVAGGAGLLLADQRRSQSNQTAPYVLVFSRE